MYDTTRMKVGDKVTEILDESGRKMREGVVTVLKIYNVWGRTRIDVDYGDGEYTSLIKTTNELLYGRRIR